MFNDFRHKKFLIIDDFIDFRKSLRFMLQTYGAINIDEAGNGETAINLIQKNSYDIILCDYNLGNNSKDGQQILEEIKYRRLIKLSTIFIMITAENTQAMVMGAIEYCPDDYLVKPFTKEMLKLRIERALKKKIYLEGIESAILESEYHYAIAICDQHIHNNSQNKFELLRLKGELLLQIGDYFSAGKLYKDILSIREITWAKIGLGKVFYHEENYEQAEEIFKSVIENNKMIIEAYDWLAKTLIEKGESEKAQSVLQKAVEISPKSALRQNMLGKVSLQNNDLEVSEKAFKASISYGKYSYFKSPSPYTGLVKCLINKNDSESALPLIKELRNEFKESVNANFQAATLKSLILKKMNRNNEALEAAKEASELLDKTEENPPNDILLDLAKTFIELGEKEKGLEYINEIVKNNHDDSELLQKVQNKFHEIGMDEEGKELISMTKKEVIQINNNGVRLVEQGKLHEAIESFEKAYSKLPWNKIIIANTAQAILMYLQKNGRNEAMLKKAKTYLDRLYKLDSTYKKIPQLKDMYERMVTA